MALLDVNALVALAWDSHVHHARMRTWFAANSLAGWATCPITESGFVRVSSNPKVLPSPISVDAAQEVLSALRKHPGHRFLTDNVSMSDDDVPRIIGYRQVTDAHLLALARRRKVRLVTFDASILTMNDRNHVEVLTTLSDLFRITAMIGVSSRSEPAPVPVQPCGGASRVAALSPRVRPYRR